MHGIHCGKFAVKVICIGDDLHRLIDILREVRTLQQLHHRNVVEYKHSWLENYQPAISGPQVPCLFILMEYADRGSLYEYIIIEDEDGAISHRKWLTEHEIWTILFETCMGLRHLHQHGIVHRDLKPGNLLMSSLHRRHRIGWEELELYDTDYRILLGDLGQADFVNSTERTLKTGNTGSIGFVAPEQVMDEHCSEKVDIWSIGQILYFLTFSRLPYEEWLEDEQEIDLRSFYRDVISGKKKLVFPVNHGRSRLMVDMIRNLCHLDPQERPSLDVVILAIADILRSHQYISISHGSSASGGKSVRAITAPARCQENSNHDVSVYPMVKYVPKW